MSRIPITYKGKYRRSKTPYILGTSKARLFSFVGYVTRRSEKLQLKKKFKDD